MTVVPFPIQGRGASGHGTIHVIHSQRAFWCSHESASGNSWGEMFGPYRDVSEAICAAHGVNRSRYGGKCEVYVPPKIHRWERSEEESAS